MDQAVEMAHFLLRKPFIKKGLTVATNLLLLTLDVVVSVVTNMKSPQIFPTVFAVTVFAMTQAAAPVLAQSTDNWQRFDNPAPQAGNSQAAPQISSSQPDPTLAQAQAQEQGSPNPYPQAPPPPPAYNTNGGYQNGNGGQYGPPPQGQYGPPAQGQYQYGAPQGNYQAPPPQERVPDALNLTAGKYLTVRVNNFLTSDHNQPGDAFTATLVEPIVIDGFVVAQRGQMVNGRVVEVQKAGRVKGVSSMRIELTGLTLLDGQQLPIKTTLIDRKGQTSNGRDASAVVGTTALGAIVGAAATGTGFGAGMGAIGGVVVGTVGVLVTRGRPTVITPESVMTFRVEQPITISTTHSAGAFYAVSREDYGPGGGPGGPSFAARPYPYPPVGAYPYASPYYGSYWGPSLYVGGFGYYGRGFYGRGYYGRGWRR